MAQAAKLLQTVKTLQELEQVDKAVAFVFSRRGFTREALDYFQMHDIAWSNDEHWLG